MAPPPPGSKKERQKVTTTVSKTAANKQAGNEPTAAPVTDAEVNLGTATKVTTINIGNSANPTVTITGNLNVTGTTTSIKTVNTVINDNIIGLNGGLNGVSLKDSGLIINRGGVNGVKNAFMGWDETNDRFALGLTTRDAATDQTTMAVEVGTLAANLFGNADTASGYAANGGIASAVSSLTTRVSTAESSLTSALSSETSARGSADSSLTSALSSETSARESADSSLTSALSSETSARGSAITSAVSVEASARESAITSALSSLTSNLPTASALTSALSSEASARESADSSLSTALSSHLTQLYQTIETLQTRVSNLEVVAGA